MGGCGSGRTGGKSTTDQYRALDVRRLQHDGLLTPGQDFGWHWSRRGKEVASIQIRTEVDRVILSYRSRSNGGEWETVEYPVRLEWTGLHFGGRRAWFRCPAKGCGRRVAILYSGSIFACRHCRRLAYACQRERSEDRAIRRADTIRDQLGWVAGIANPIGGKPKWMRWRTFERLMHRYCSFCLASCEGIDKRFGLMNQRMSRALTKLRGC